MAVNLEYHMGNILRVLIFCVFLIFEINTIAQHSPGRLQNFKLTVEIKAMVCKSTQSSTCSVCDSGCCNRTINSDRIHIYQFGQDVVGFVSIDCGSNAQSTDDITNLLWVEDGDYTTSGLNGYIQDATILRALNYSSYNDALQTFRYFSEKEMKSKYCYALPLTTSNIAFLVRAMFVHGNASELQLPIQFDMYVNASFWFGMNFTGSDNLYQPRFRESIFFSPPGGNMTYICLVPKQGVPFISSLELREFDPEGLMYTRSFFDNKQFFLSTSIRYNNVASLDIPTVRYPDDTYDRLWFPITLVFNDSQAMDYLEVPKNWSKIGPEVNSVPSKVMESAWQGKITGHVLIPFELPRTKPRSFTYAIFYFAKYNSAQRLQQINLDATAFPSFTVTNQPSQQNYFHVLNENQTLITFSSPFVVNAMEFYRADGILQQTTDKTHVDMLNFIKEALNMRSWQGDPCTPVPYDWIGCYLEYKGFKWLVNTLTLSHLKNVSGLTRLDHTQWISKNDDIVSDLGEQDQTINYMSITDSNVDSTLFKSLLQNFVQPSWLISLNMSFNNISMFPDSQWWFNAVSNSSTDRNLTSLDLSHNKLTQIPCFKDIPFFHQIQTLNLSNNMIIGEFPDAKCFSNLTNLKVLVLSNNYLHGKIPSSLSTQTLPSLEVIDISNNKFSGHFPSHFYFADGGITFQSMNADNNDLFGVLDLNQWYQNLKATSENISEGLDSLNWKSKVNNNTHNQVLKFSFLHNQISNIEPGIEEFQPLIENLIQREDFNQSGILLGGNPFCRNGNGFTQRYFCRLSINDSVNADVKIKSQTAFILIVGSSVSSAAFIVILGGLLLCWYHRRQRKNRTIDPTLLRMEILREMQVKGGANICKIFSLEELEKATSNFGDDKVVGIGGFGKIYRGVLNDGTEVAIKKAKRDVAGGRDDTKQFINEVTILSTINHHNLVKLLGCCLETVVPILVYEFISNGSLSDYIQRTKCLSNENFDGPLLKSLDWGERLKIAIGTATALSYLHSGTSPPIYHRDVKSANILLDKKYVAKVADFGLSKLVPVDAEDMHPSTAVQGTPGYLDPEYIETYQMTEKSDVYSFGVVLLELLTAEKALDFSLRGPDQNLALRCRRLLKFGLFEEVVDPSLDASSNPDMLEAVYSVAQVAIECCGKNGHNRPTMRQVESKLRSLRDSSNLRSPSRHTSSVTNRARIGYVGYDFEAVDTGDSTSFTGGELTNFEDPVGHDFEAVDAGDSASFTAGELTNSEDPVYSNKSASGH